MSTTNTTDRFRISCDTRWQPASDPIDERWQGSPTDGEAFRFFIGDEPAAEEGLEAPAGAKATMRKATQLPRPPVPGEQQLS